jgi:hypothetical protein
MCPRTRKNTRLVGGKPEGVVGLVVLSVAPLWQPAPCHGGMLGDEWSRFDRALSIFDPAGASVSQPIKKSVPALSFKGFFRQWSDINLHRN